MSLFNGAAKLHKAALDTLIQNSNVELTLRDAAPVVSTGVNPYYGSLSRETSKLGAEHGPFRCLWYDALTLTRGSQTGMFRGNGLGSTIEQLAGQYREADSFAELSLAELLIDENDPYGLTMFDRCQWVINETKRYKYLGSVRFGLAVVAPYAIVVALKGSVGLTE